MGATRGHGLTIVVIVLAILLAGCTQGAAPRAGREVGPEGLPPELDPAGTTRVEVISLTEEDIEQYPLGRAVERLAGELGRELKGDGGPTKLAVFPLAPAGAPMGELGRYLADKLIGELAALDWVHLVERERYDYALRELELQQSALADSATVARIGKVLGAERVALGTLRDLGDRVDVDLRVVDVETSVIRAQAAVRIVKDERVVQLMAEAAPPPVAAGPAAEGLEVAFTILAERHNGHEWELVDVTKGANLRSGDQFQVRFRPNRDCHVYVLSRGASGRLYRFHPAERFGNTEALVRGGQERRIPAEGFAEGGWLILDDRPGTESFILLATLERFSDERLRDLLARLEETGGALAADEAEEAVAAIGRASEVAVFHRSVQVLKRGLAPQVLKRDVAGSGSPHVEQEFILSDGKKVAALVEVVEGAAEVVHVVSFEHKRRLP